ncbi:PREDICTED: uncharacterized protein LOC109589489 isoform X1 [Amphimedon queenslandica]|uniref:Uncharacterized protein n=1 Tax=Amphimedon queenslandica TaxID=400682 RepID=A0AAN0JVD4_AMPQE|nr:PREDICTED: uncharacterized protein LOC109589489 isoform X1 [Amphimedon queenslandica]XP_019861124.1 PREDICTED: uncharacterized protein LOC109589489 isoform X1 [Amphimedon queenslandica]|eukprot:XP_019861123.1 PREDICTED: uncharacterized protein LOC109589489 isoform X1 [Amphimedon queenslandica]
MWPPGAKVFYGHVLKRGAFAFLFFNSEFKSDIKRLNGEVYLFESKEIWAVILQRFSSLLSSIRPTLLPIFLPPFIRSSTFGMSDVSQLSFVCSLHSTRLIEHSIDHQKHLGWTSSLFC